MWNIRCKGISGKLSYLGRPGGPTITKFQTLLEVASIKSVWEAGNEDSTLAISPAKEGV